jgi:hypothetical protein
MEDIFEIIGAEEKEQGKDLEVGIGFRLMIGSRQIRCPVSNPCHSYEELEEEAQGIISRLNVLLVEAKELFVAAGVSSDLGLSPEMEPDAIWSILSLIEDEDLFVATFNGLEEERRRKMAEYILTECNIFAGNAAVFSSRYEGATGRLE